MPALHLFGRAWKIAGDDLVVPVLLELLMRIVWLMALVIIVNVTSEAFKCQSGVMLKLYCISFSLVLVAHIILCVFIAHISHKGTVMDDRPRHKLPILLYLKVPLYFMELFCIILGLYWSFGDSTNCSRLVVVTIIVIASIDSMVLVFTFVVSMFSLGIGLENIGMGCLFFCSHHKELISSFKKSANVLTSIFKNSDLVMSDVVAGLVLLYQLQQNLLSRFQWQAGHEAPPLEWMNIDSVAHFSKFATAPYGVLMVSMLRTTKKGRALLKKSRCCSCSCFGMGGSHIKGDCCLCNTRALYEIAGVEDEDVIYADYSNQIYETPFLVVLDHDTDSIVIAIRGTLSIKDALIDLNAAACSATLADCEGFVHDGMQRSSDYVLSKLFEQGILLRATRRAQGYDIVVVGHSLGAGTAALVTLKLKQSYPNVHCYAYSPPAMISSSLLRKSEECILSIILGQDLVPRLGVVSAKRLLKRIVTTLKHSDQAKWQILSSGIAQVLCGCKVSEESKLLMEDEEYADFDTAEENEDESLQMVPPGRVLFIEKEETLASDESDESYKVGWASALLFDVVEVSPNMFTHHMPDRVLHACHAIQHASLPISRVLIVPGVTRYLSSGDINY